MNCNLSELNCRMCVGLLFLLLLTSFKYDTFKSLINGLNHKAELPNFIQNSTP